MQIFQFLPFFIITLHCIFASKEVELECDVSQEHFSSKTCSVTITKCTINRAYREFESDSKLSFTNADSENFTLIDLNHLKIKRFPSEIFTQFPVLTHVELKNNLFEEFPKLAFEHADELTEINLYSNKIKILNNDTFAGASNLLTLHLSRNAIKELPNGIFEETPLLVYLDLESNSIKSIEETVFWPLKNLKTLNLKHNDIKSIDRKAFLKNHDLSFLYLCDLKMESLTLTFDDMHLYELNLKRSSINSINLGQISGKAVAIDLLNVENSKITNISMVKVDESIALKEIDFKDCEIEKIEVVPSIFTKYTKGLSTLRLSGNKIKKFPREIAENFVSLKTLYLDENRDLEMKSGMFASLKSLKSLSIAENRLKSIDLDWFSGLPNLEFLDLRRNSLESLDYKNLSTIFPSLKSLSINENAFSCDFVTEMITYLKNNTHIHMKEYKDVEFLHNFYYSEAYGITCGGTSQWDHEGEFLYNDYYHSYDWLSWFGALLIIGVALVTTFILLKKDSCKICCGVRSYEGMSRTTTNENVLTEIVGTDLNDVN